MFFFSFKDILISMQVNYSQTIFCSTYVFSRLQFALLCIYNFVFLVFVELPSESHSYVSRKPLKITSKTDSRTKTGQSRWKAEWKEKKSKGLCVDANGPVLGCVRSTACRQSVSVFWWMRACMGFRWRCCTSGGKEESVHVQTAYLSRAEDPPGFSHGANTPV